MDEGVRIDRFEEWAAGNGKDLCQILDIYRASLSEAIEKVLAANRSGDAPGLRRASHDLRNCFLLVGARRAIDCAQEVEIMAQEGRIGDAGALVEELERESAAVERALEERLCENE